MKDNLELWNRVSETDARFTKRAEFGRQFTSINPTYQAMLLTEVFGQAGQKWGLRNLTYSTHTVQGYMATAETHKKKKSERKYVLTDITILSLECEFWYIDEDGVEGCIEVAANTQLTGDDSEYKKLRTECRSKAISDLGFNADVFFGEFDDQTKVQEKKILAALNECETAEQVSAAYEKLDNNWKNALHQHFAKRIAQINGTEPVTS